MNGPILTAHEWQTVIMLALIVALLPWIVKGLRDEARLFRKYWEERNTDD